MDWQSVAILGVSISAAILALFYLYVYCVERSKAMGVLTLAWFFYSMKFIFMLVVHTGIVYPWLLLNQIFSIGNGLLLLWGILLWANKRMPIYWLCLGLGVLAWSFYTTFDGMNFFWIFLPISLFIGLTHIVSGFVLIWNTKLPWRYLIGVSFVLWGLHKFDYPWLKPIETIAPYGYAFSTVLCLVIAGGLLMSYLRQTKDDLKQSEEKLRRIAEGIHDAFWIVSPDWSEVKYISPAYENIWGKSIESLYEQPKSWLDSVIEEDRPLLLDGIDSAVEGGFHDIVFPEYRIATPDGEIKWIEAEAYPVCDDNGNVVSVVGLARDITKRKNAEIDLEQTNIFLEALIECRHVIMHAVDEKQMFDGICKTLSTKVGYPLVWIGIKQVDEHRVVKPVAAYGPEKKYIRKIFISWKDGDFGNGPTGRAIRTLLPQIQYDLKEPSYKAWHKPADEHGFKCSAAIPLISGEHAIGTINIYSYKENAFSEKGLGFLQELAGDIAYGVENIEARLRRDQAEKSLSEREQNFSRMLNSNAVGIFCATLDGKISSSNDTFIHMLGYTRNEFLQTSMRWDNLTPEEFGEIDQKAVDDLKTNNYTMPFQKEYICKDGSRLPVLISASMVEDASYDVVVYVIDLTELEQTKKQLDRVQAELRQAQKMDAVGQLAGGIAHDFNNILMAIQGNADILKSLELIKDTGDGYIDEILKASDRAADLTTQLLTFSRKRSLQVESVNMHHAIGEVSNLLSRSLDKVIELEVNLQAKKFTLQGDSTQLHSALLNIGINARDAMPKGGKLTFTTKNIMLNTQDIAAKEGLVKAGEYLEVTISDTGKGMDEKVIEHIFEPFFTTKEVGKGTGLGLASVYGCIKEHKGHISVESEPGAGTVFTIVLPLTSELIKQRKPNAKPSKIAPESKLKRVLVVDDEPSVQTFIRCSLEQNGYEVYCYGNGEDAVAFFKENAKMVDLVILDVVMPKISGSHTFHALKEIDPDIKVMIISGFSRDAAIEQLLEAGALGFISKPFRIKTFLGMVNRYLG